MKFNKTEVLSMIWGVLTRCQEENYNVGISATFQFKNGKKTTVDCYAYEDLEDLYIDIRDRSNKNLKSKVGTRLIDIAICRKGDD